MPFCMQCGASLAPGQGFCTRCGAAARATAASSPAAPVNVVPIPNAASANPAPRKSGAGKILLIVMLLLLTGAALAVGGTYYVYHRVKQKVVAALHSNEAAGSDFPDSSSTNKRETAGAGVAATSTTPTEAQGDASSDAGGDGVFSAWTPETAADAPSSQPTPSSPPGSAANPAMAEGPAPLREGMNVVTAIADQSGDYQSFKTIGSIEPNRVTLLFKADAHGKGQNQDPAVHITRVVSTQDLLHAHDYAETFGNTDSESMPGTTAITASSEVLQQLKTTGQAELGFRPDGLKGAIGSALSVLTGMAGVSTKDLGLGDTSKLEKESCTLHRSGSGLVAFPVLLNDQPVKLPGVRATCSTDDGPAEFVILDQPAYPLMLTWKLGNGSRLQVVQITYPAPKPATPTAKNDNAIEQQLEEQKKVELYGIYFDFASDHLKPESAPVLQDIAAALKTHPDWKLNVNGHTDNIGGDPYNQDLSERRAAAVKQALVSQYGIDAGRLAPAGFGASQPLDTNATLAGRARNRRVELIRQ